MTHYLQTGMGMLTLNKRLVFSHYSLWVLFFRHCHFTCRTENFSGRGTRMAVASCWRITCVGAITKQRDHFS